MSTVQRSIITATLFLLAIYLGSYFTLSRRGFQAADQQGYEGFYFHAPADADRWRLRESRLRLLYGPLIYVDCWVGTGRRPGAEPLWSIE